MATCLTCGKERDNAKFWIAFFVTDDKRQAVRRDFCSPGCVREENGRPELIGSDGVSGEGENL